MRIILPISLALNILLIGALIFLYNNTVKTEKIIYDAVIDNGAVEAEAYTEKIPEYNTKIGPWGPPVEELKMHKKW